MAFLYRRGHSTPMKTQILEKIRTVILLLAFLLFPVTLNYLSPVIPLTGAAAGIVSGSILIFCLQFIVAVFLGRSFCSWMCPGGFIGDQVGRSRNKRVSPRRIGWIKFAVWGLWLALLLFLFRRAGGVKAVHFGYGTEGGLSVTSAPALMAYTMVVLVFFLMSLIFGRRAGCHCLCWMAPFMIIGRKAGLGLGVPSLRLEGHPESCVSCGRCTAVCPMSLDVQALIKTGKIIDNNCILCGRCMAACGPGSISWTWSQSR